jgi:hypothetical protein
MHKLCVKPEVCCQVDSLVLIIGYAPVISCHFDVFCSFHPSFVGYIEEACCFLLIIVAGPF